LRKDTHAVLLLLVGETLLKISFAGTYVRYVKPSSRWLLIACGVALLVVAVATLWEVVRAQMSASKHHPRREHREHEHTESKVGWLLLVPALVLLVLAPPALGSFQASRSGTALTAHADSNVDPLPDGDPVRISVLDYASRSVFDDGRSLTGRRVTLSGFVMAGPDGTWYLARMIVTCCAADARPIKVGLTGAVPAMMRLDDWIEVDGSYTDRIDHDPVNDDVIPFIQVSAVRTTAAPESQYES
jgi:uncharacterized repeat protein (TIGR03943 family)